MNRDGTFYETNFAPGRKLEGVRFRTGPLDLEEHSAAVTICDRALAACHDRDMAYADAVGILDMCGLLREAKP